MKENERNERTCQGDGGEKVSRKRERLSWSNAVVFRSIETERSGDLATYKLSKSNFNEESGSRSWGVRLREAE